MKELELGHMSDFCREAIIEKCQREFSNQYADSQIEHHQNKIKEWKEKKKQGSQLSNSEDIISEFHHDPGKPEIHDDLSRNFCFKYFKDKYWPRIRNLPEFKLKNPADVFNEILEAE